MTITDRCEHCGARFQIDDAIIFECKKKNKWKCHCPNCHKYIDVKKYEFMFAYEFPGTENKIKNTNTKNENNIVNYAFDRNYPNLYKNAYLFLKKIGLCCLISSILLIFLGFILVYITDNHSFSLIAFVGGWGLVTSWLIVLLVPLFYHQYWKYENFMRLVEK